MAKQYGSAKPLGDVGANYGADAKQCDSSEYPLTAEVGNPSISGADSVFHKTMGEAFGGSVTKPIPAKGASGDAMHGG
jgi:hypothetical protein